MFGSCGPIASRELEEVHSSLLGTRKGEHAPPAARRIRLRRIAPYLDRALELEPPERDGWLTGLTTTDPQIAHEVRAVLAEIAALDARGFLSRSPLRASRDVEWTGTRIGATRSRSASAAAGIGGVWLASRSDGRYEGRAAVKATGRGVARPAAEQRWRREVSLLAQLRHPNIAQLNDAGVAPSGQPYLVLDTSTASALIIMWSGAVSMSTLACAIRRCARRGRACTQPPRRAPRSSRRTSS